MPDNTSRDEPAPPRAEALERILADDAEILRRLAAGSEDRHVVDEERSEGRRRLPTPVRTPPPEPQTPRKRPTRAEARAAAEARRAAYLAWIEQLRAQSLDYDDEPIPPSTPRAARPYEAVVTRDGDVWLADVPTLRGTHTYASPLRRMTGWRTQINDLTKSIGIKALATVLGADTTTVTGWLSDADDAPAPEATDLRRIELLHETYDQAAREVGAATASRMVARIADVVGRGPTATADLDSDVGIVAYAIVRAAARLTVLRLAGRGGVNRLVAERLDPTGLITLAILAEYLEFAGMRNVAITSVLGGARVEVPLPQVDGP